MTISETYPLHHCVYRNDVEALKELLVDNNMKKLINETDNHGNTAAHLALMLNRHNCLYILLQNGCDIFTHNAFGWSPLDEAGLTGNTDLLEKMVFIKWSEIIRKVTEPGGLLDQWSATTPNLYFKLKAKVKTTIPLLQRLGYKDVIEFYKKGDSVRMDFTIGGFDVRGIPKIIRGKMSYIFKNENGVYKLYLVDHDSKKYQEFFPDIPKWYLANSLAKRLSNNGLRKFFIDFTGFIFKDRKNLLKKSTKTFTMESGESYKCIKKSGKKLNLIIRKRFDEANIGVSESIINIKFDKGDPYENSLDKFLKKNESSGSSSISSSTDSTEFLDDDSDSEYNSESDSDSGEEEEIKISRNKSLPRQNSKNTEVSEYMTSIFNSKEENTNKNSGSSDSSGGAGDNEKNTVMYTISKDGETKTFEVKTELEDTLDWEQAYIQKYSNNDNNFVFDFLNDKADDRSNKKHLNHMDIVKFDFPKVTEEDYFNPNATQPLHMGRIMNVIERKKPYNHKIRFWVAKEESGFPLKMTDIKPLFELIVMVVFDQIKTREGTSEMDRAAYNFLTHVLVDRAESKHTFPVKMSIPIYPSVAFQTTFLNCSKEAEKVPDDLMDIPKDYTMDDIFFKVIRN